MNENLLTKEELAVRLNLSVHRIDKLRKNDKLPYIKMGRNVRFNLEEVNQFLKKYGKENAK
ncbi:excisionase family DNA-binding protein [Aliarcobacter butzleri]|uniref:Excisionase family DNA-binding protein n=1 Tax=Aliarcobacter butzleri TaxID=28197 RepID=A0AAW7PUI6_9BACT|nr:excisionase family DNA-binding protein [Aliarcobacter butzleri]MDN5069417.1 excisionase family DNA-binding protein [Aliarcobacter butzleri]